MQNAFQITTFKYFFLMWTILKVFIVTTLLLFYVSGLLLLIFGFFFFLPLGMWDLNSLTRNWTCNPYVERWSPSHWTTREVPQIKNLNTYSHLGLKINFWVGWTYIIVNILILVKLRDIVTFSKIQTVSGESWSSTEVCSIKIPLSFPHALRLF